MTVLLVQQGHYADEQCAEHEDDDIDGEVEFDHQGIQTQHEEDADVLVEVLHGDGAACAHQKVAAMLQQGVHGNDEVTCHHADADEQQDGEKRAVYKNHRQHGESHADTDRDDVHRVFQFDEARREDGADGDTDRDPCGELGGFTDAVMQSDGCPCQYEQTQCGTSPPEQSGHSQRDLAQRVFPQQTEAVREIIDEEDRIAAEWFVFDSDLRDVQVEHRRNEVDEEDDKDGQLGRGDEVWHVQTLHDGVRDAWCDEQATDHRAHDDGSHGQAFHPAVRPDQSIWGEVFGEDAVFRGRVCRRTKTGEGVGDQWVHARQHGETAHHLDGVADEHDLALGQRVGKSAHKGRQQNEGDDERLLQDWRLPARGVHLLEQRDGGK